MKKTDERKREVRQQVWAKRKKKIRVIVYAVLLAAIVLVTVNFKRILTAAFWNIDTFRLKEVRITPYQARDLITGLMELETGGNMLFLDTDGLREQILRIKEVEDCRVMKVFPSTLEIEVILRKPWAVVQFAGRGFLIDRTGRMLDPAGDISGFLKVIGISLDGTGVIAEDTWKTDVLKEIEKWYNFNNLQRYFAIDTVIIGKPTEIVLKVAGDSRRIIMVKEDVRKKFEQLGIVLDECAKNEVKWEYVDLRFDNPYVKYAKEEAAPQKRGSQ